MKILKNILKHVSVIETHGAIEVSVLGLSLDSRKIEKDFLYAALKGTQVDGHDFISSAIENGANTILCEVLPSNLQDNVTYILVENSALSLGFIASNFYNNPSKYINVVAVTGTNGKTSIATMLFQVFKKLGYKCGLLSTVENKIAEKTISASHTTPNSIVINQLLDQMVKAACSYCFMEASSHAIHQNRMMGLHLKGAVFTNLTHDHLDYHESFKEYLLAKKSLFDALPNTAFALSNRDDKNGRVMLQNTKALKKYYAMSSRADFVAKIIECDFSGMLLSINNQEVYVKVIGGFNAYNLLAVYGTAILLNQDSQETLIALSEISGAEGRFEYTLSPIDKIVGVIDYAHTPDALKKVLETISSINIQSRKIYTVIGCGGDRDAQKRPLMGAIAAKLSSKAILTSDNPRTENPQHIIDEMYHGVRAGDRKKVLQIENRKQAIETAVNLADEEDIILVAGKGHESYQEINGVRYPFNDLSQLNLAFKKYNK